LEFFSFAAFRMKAANHNPPPVENGQAKIKGPLIRIPKSSILDQKRFAA
jgi:hypothetical protein